MKKIAAALGLVMAATSWAGVSSSLEDFQTVGALASQCRAAELFMRGKPVPKDQGDDLVLCFGYIAGEGEAVAAAGDFLPYCRPQGALVGQRALIFLAWADRHPETHHLARIYGLQAALAETFPCQPPTAP